MNSSSHGKEREEVRLGPMSKAHLPTKNSYKAKQQNKNVTKTFDYTTIAD